MKKISCSIHNSSVFLLNFFIFSIIIYSHIMHLLMPPSLFYYIFFTFLYLHILITHLWITSKSIPPNNIIFKLTSQKFPKFPLNEKVHTKDHCHNLNRTVQYNYSFNYISPWAKRNYIHETPINTEVTTFKSSQTFPVLRSSRQSLQRASDLWWNYNTASGTLS